MSSSHQEEVISTQETEITSPVTSKKRIIHFSSGETMEEEDSDEEGDEGEQSRNTSPFRDPTERTRLSFKKVAILVGRISLLTCDFLGERLAGALGLTAAKYQYAIDQYQRDHVQPSREDTGDVTRGHGEIIRLSPRADGGHYGAVRGPTCPAGPHRSPDENHGIGHVGYYNTSYEADDDCLK